MKKFALIASAILVTILMTLTFSVAEEHVVDISFKDETPNYSYYGEFTGTVVKIENLDGNTMLTVEKGENNANMVIYKDTLILNGEKLAVGETVTGFYELDKPMIIPAQTTPAKVIVMDDKITDPSLMSIKVNSEAIITPAPIVNDGGIMLPVRSIAEALGYSVMWNNSTKSVYLTYLVDLVSFRIGEKGCYNIIGSEDYVFEAVPFIENSCTFLPLSFFETVLGCHVTADGEIMITADTADTIRLK